DGDREVETALSLELLQDGSLVYLRQSGDIEIRLRIHGPKSASVKELTRLIGLPVPLPPAADIKPMESSDRPSDSPKSPRAMKKTLGGAARPPKPELVLSREMSLQALPPSLSASTAAPAVAPPLRIPTPAQPSSEVGPVSKPTPAYRGPLSGRVI